ncbi:MAG TPA: DUF4133 domain-containing protein [Puia sp.]|nr:DUF4133 domain-containing protein [Puia sp.]
MKTYKIDRAIGRPIEFRGLKAQYLGRLGALMVGLVAVMAVLHLLGMSSYLIVLLASGLGGISVRRLYRLNRIYGQHGLMKRRARRSMPSTLYSRSRQIFTQLSEHESSCKLQ